MISWTATIVQLYKPAPGILQLFLENSTLWHDITVPNDCGINFEIGDTIEMETENIRYISISVPGKGIYKWQHMYR